MVQKLLFRDQLQVELWGKYTMLNRDQMHSLGRFTFLMRKTFNQKVQVERFINDADYQNQMLALASRISDDTSEELLKLSMELGNKFESVA